MHNVCSHLYTRINTGKNVHSIYHIREMANHTYDILRPVCVCVWRHFYHLIPWYMHACVQASVAGLAHTCDTYTLPTELLAFVSYVHTSRSVWYQTLISINIFCEIRPLPAPVAYFVVAAISFARSSGAAVIVSIFYTVDFELVYSTSNELTHSNHAYFYIIVVTEWRCYKHITCTWKLKSVNATFIWMYTNVR